MAAYSTCGCGCSWQINCAQRLSVIRCWVLRFKHKIEGCILLHINPYTTGMQMLTGLDAADGLDKFYGTLKIVWRWQSYTLHRLDIATNQGTEYQRPDRAKKKTTLCAVTIWDIDPADGKRNVLFLHFACKTRGTAHYWHPGLTVSRLIAGLRWRGRQCSDINSCCRTATQQYSAAIFTHTHCSL